MKRNCYKCINKNYCRLRAISYCEENVREEGCEHYLNIDKQNTILEKALELACEELEVAKDMLNEQCAYDLANTLNTNADYFKAIAKFRSEL